MKKILFVCIENSNRSQMAEAFAKIHGKEKVLVYSAGSRPSGIVNPKAIAAMKEAGYDLTLHESKSVNDFRNIEFEYVVTMGCGDECPFIKSTHHIDWAIPDPKNLLEKEFLDVRNLIEQKVKTLIEKLS